MLAETIDAGLLRIAAERKNDEQILVQIRGKDRVALQVNSSLQFSPGTKLLATKS